jgi:ornithine cyclodeaminase/alanine dehydrogenase-like protein (mu-crystallin family)
LRRRRRKPAPKPVRRAAPKPRPIGRAKRRVRHAARRAEDAARRMENVSAAPDDERSAPAVAPPAVAPPVAEPPRAAAPAVARHAAPGGSILYLSRADVETAGVTMPEIIARLEEAFREKGHGRVEMPPKPGIHPGDPAGDNFIHAMPASIPGLRSAGVKWVSGFPGNPARGLPYISGLLILNDPETGAPTAVMDATWITAMRTGAATALAVRHLARPAASTFAILGCGVQGRTNLEAVAAVLPALRAVTAFDVDRDRAARYIEEMKGRHPALSFVLAPDARGAVEGADIVVTAGPIRRHPQPVIEAGWLAEGMLGVPLDYDSYFTPGAMAAADRFYTDDTAQILHTRAKGVYFQRIPKVFADLGEVVAGLKPGRLEDRERLLSMNLGIAMDDMATAPLVLERARERGLGIPLPV